LSDEPLKMGSAPPGYCRALKANGGVCLAQLRGSESGELCGRHLRQQRRLNGLDIGGDLENNKDEDEDKDENLTEFQKENKDEPYEFKKLTKKEENCKNFSHAGSSQTINYPSCFTCKIQPNCKLWESLLFALESEHLDIFYDRVRLAAALASNGDEKTGCGMYLSTGEQRIVDRRKPYAERG